MERTKKVEPEKPKIAEEIVVPIVPVDTRLRWKKVGGGTLTFRNRYVKPGEIILAHAEELPKAFMDTLVCLDKDQLGKVQEVKRKETHTPEILYTIKKEGKGWWVVNATGKPLNEEPLTQPQAEELMKAMNG